LQQQLIELINRLATNQNDAATILTKLDGCVAEVEKIRKDQLPWHISQEQANSLSKALNSVEHAGSKVSVHVLPSDHDSSVFGKELADTLIGIQWMNSTSYTSDFTVNPQLIGVVVLVKNPNFAPAIALLSALKDAGFNPQGGLDAKGERVTDDNEIQILIGSKPKSIN
ncbi:MAG TPA: hypothetical protein VL346_00505, partial [Acidobacteriaceae bacterium]|nr:hypothetical protein [Acidobacteriaceae bacterium]